ncbi:toprim domain-containing protein [Cupriavidus basilensis]
MEAHGLRFGKGCILVPVRDAAGQLWNLQRIYGKPLSGGNDKIFLKGGRVSGCYHVIGTPDAAGWLLVAEGYATAATLHQVCGLPVVVAFNASNLRHVAETMRRLFPDAQLLICADDDRATEAETGKNPGLLAAKDAARRARGQMVAPAGLPEDGSDFNDLARASGTEQVRQQL